MYLLGLALDFLFGQRIVILLIKKFWSRAVMKTIGIEWELVGLKSEAHVFVSNHISWIDILAINSILDVVFIAKKEAKSLALFKLVQHVKQVIDNKFGVKLEEEIIFIGEFDL